MDVYSYDPERRRLERWTASEAGGLNAEAFVRPELMTDDLRRSHFIFATLETLESTLEHYLTHPQELAVRRAGARESILRLHDNPRIAAQYAALYRQVVA